MEQLAKPQGRQVSPDLSARVREICRTRHLSLRKLAAMTGIPVATLSKVQNNLATLSYVQLIKLADGLGIELNELFTASAVDVKKARRAVTRRGEGPKESTERYDVELLCVELKNRWMNTAVIELTARTIDEAGGMTVHQGEEFAYVLSGVIEVHTEDYQPTRLEVGDCIYMDSTSAHAYLNSGQEPVARVLVVTTHQLGASKQLSE